jgi:hypothetical protein
MPGDTLKLPLLPHEQWWGGLTVDGFQMPYKSGFTRDLSSLHGNQGMPLLLSNKGRYVWSDEPFTFSFTEKNLVVTSNNKAARLEQGRSVVRHGERADFRLASCSIRDASAGVGSADWLIGGCGIDGSGERQNATRAASIGKRECQCHVAKPHLHPVTRKSTHDVSAGWV